MTITMSPAKPAGTTGCRSREDGKSLRRVGLSRAQGRRPHSGELSVLPALQTGSACALQRFGRQEKTP
jgi:hypothetical protein